MVERLEAAAFGRIGVDQRLIRTILEDSENPASEVLRFARSKRDDFPIDLEPLLLDLFRHFQSPEALDFYVDAIRRNPEEIDDERVVELPEGNYLLVAAQRAIDDEEEIIDLFFERLAEPARRSNSDVSTQSSLIAWPIA